MIVEHQKIIDCTAIELSACSDNILVSLEHGTDFKLRADAPGDILHGSVSILHNDPPVPHQIVVTVYDVDEAPTAIMVHGALVGRQSTLKRPSAMPTEQNIKDRLGA